MFAIIVLFIGAFVLYSSSDFIEFDENGVPRLSSKRETKLLKDLDEFENSEQYVLVAIRDGYYDCYNCGEKNTIFLHKGEIWKYGVTRKGEKARYGEWHINRGLIYVTEFKGPLQKCLRLEKIKIVKYAIHPENLKREKPLIRPPGNKRDS